MTSLVQEITILSVNDELSELQVKPDVTEGVIDPLNQTQEGLWVLVHVDQARRDLDVVLHKGQVQARVSRHKNQWLHGLDQIMVHLVSLQIQTLVFRFSSLHENLERFLLVVFEVVDDPLDVTTHLALVAGSAGLGRLGLGLEDGFSVVTKLTETLSDAFGTDHIAKFLLAFFDQIRL